jgi:hypothetical protein
MIAKELIPKGARETFVVNALREIMMSMWMAPIAVNVRSKTNDRLDMWHTIKTAGICRAGWNENLAYQVNGNNNSRLQHPRHTIGDIDVCFRQSREVHLGACYRGVFSTDNWCCLLVRVGAVTDR